MPAIAYLSVRLIANIYQFIQHWYIFSFLNVSHATLDLFESLDRTFAFKISLRNLFKPLYQDRTIIGYMLGFISRFFRIIIGAVVYAVIFLVIATFYILWLATPILIIYKIFF